MLLKVKSGVFKNTLVRFFCLKIALAHSNFLSCKGAQGWHESKPVFNSYLEIAESHHVSDHIFGFYEQRYVCREVFGATNADSCQNHVLAVLGQLHRFRTKPTPDSDSPWSKALATIWNLGFFGI